ncbi:ATP-binding protein [Peptacetobacter sp.]|uniref:ATP-binding protein n=1 Tax=Peptacetobacter sp. TaxID=2991975 RepID=UPI00261881BC|nr:ATP-binding protein [Peptacetobacter sp.]
MKQLLILSGKGGTGKTTVASSFIKLSDARAYADCDVDAPNLHLVSGNKVTPDKSAYYGLKKAVINKEKCIECGECFKNCRFDSIKKDEYGYSVNSYGCEGCGVCELVCSQDAIEMQDSAAGDLMLYKENNKVFSTAKLYMGSGTSGKLVTEVKKRMKNEASEDTELSIIDGSPGIGCPVIASLNGVDMVLIVSEPSISGINDMKRILKTASRFRIKTAVCVNKFDTNIENTKMIEEFCIENKIPVVGKIPYDQEAVKAINNGITIVEADCPSGKAVKGIYNNVRNILFNDDNIKKVDNKIEINF